MTESAPDRNSLCGRELYTKNSSIFSKKTLLRWKHAYRTSIYGFLASLQYNYKAIIFKKNLRLNNNFGAKNVSFFIQSFVYHTKIYKSPSVSLDDNGSGN